jgi:peptidoglycan hydrolase-like protein with peptidoglycan-binding domain
MAALNTFNGEAAKRTADLVRSTQTELTRIGCYTGNPDGVMSDSTKNALSRYLSAKGLPTNDLTVTDTLVVTLQKQQPITCLRTCPSGQTLSGDTCVATAKPAAAPPTQAKRDDSNRKSPPPRQQADTHPAAPRASQQAASAPRPAPSSGYGGGGGGGGSHAPMVGVGF